MRFGTVKMLYSCGIEGCGAGGWGFGENANRMQVFWISVSGV
ncbi:MAG: hypothetical protein ACYDG2_26485 [Ruminiclostridium sp.]